MTNTSRGNCASSSSHFGCFSLRLVIFIAPSNDNNKKKIPTMNFFSNQPRSFENLHTHSSILIYHNFNFPYNDIENVLGPLFGNYYGEQGLRNMISTVEHIWCAYDEKSNRCLGCALVTEESDHQTLYIKLFGVHPSSQGHGIGTHLLKTILSWAKRNGYFAIVLHTQVNNSKAIGLYEKVGFKKQFYLKDFFHSQTPLWSLLSGEPDAFQMIVYL